MHKTIQNLININNLVKSKLSDLNKIDSSVKIVAVSKTFKLEHILPLIEYGHNDYGENKVQEAIDKWTEIKSKNNQIKLHLVGKLQTNKVKLAIKIFDYIHSLDNQKLAKKISDEQKNCKIKPKIFIQINIGNEIQKGGIKPNELIDFYNYCKELNLNIIGTMCLPPLEEESEIYFLRMNYLNKKISFKELSMGMSADYLEAIKYNATYLRIGSRIFGARN